MAEQMKYGLVVIGGGPAGYPAAIRAAQLGVPTCLVEMDELGGTCLNRGCIPTKTIISSVRLFDKIQRAEKYGIILSDKPLLEFSEVMRRKAEVVSKLREGVRALLKANGVSYIKGKGEIVSPGRVLVGRDEILADNIIIASGSRPKCIKGMEPDGRFILSSDEALDISELPKSVMILGGGVLGCEFGYIFSAAGAKVYIVEVMSRLLPTEDEELSRIIHRSFKRRGVEVITCTSVLDIKEDGDHLLVRLSDDRFIEVERIISAVGREPLLDGLGATKLGLQLEKGGIVTDEKMATNIHGVYAAGDVTGKYMLAHVAMEEGMVAAENIAGIQRKMDYLSIPRPIFTDPELVGVGMTKEEIVRSGIDYKEGRFFLASSAKALCNGETEGVVIVYGDAACGRILGASLAGEGVVELASEIALAIKCGLTLKDVSELIHPHPSLSEAVKEASASALGFSVHKAKR